MKKKSLKQIAFDLRALLRWKEDEIIAREREKQERDRFHELLDEERRGTRNMKGCMRVIGVNICTPTLQH